MTSYQDVLNKEYGTLSPYELATVFPECTDIAKTRLQSLKRMCSHWKKRISAVILSDIPENDKQVSLEFIKSLMSVDENVVEINYLQKYIGICEMMKKPKDERKIIDQFIIEKAKLVPIESLFQVEKPRRSSSRIHCLCPFHQEDSPSFTIYLKQNRFHCFGCNVSGDSISFVMKMFNLKFNDSVRRLA